MNIKWIGAHSNNYGSRYNNKIQFVILHWIVGSLESCDATFQSPTRLASAHYGVGDNDIHQYVKEEDCAWHAGNLLVNRQSIGIENEGGPNLPITEATYKTLAELVKDICSRYQIPVDRQHIKGHKEVSNKPTACPGTLDIDKVIKLINEDNMTDEQKRILEFLEGKTEGDVREAFGALNDLPSIQKKLSDLELKLSELDQKYNELNQNYVEKVKSEARWQKAIETANQKISEQEIKISELEKKANDNWGLYDSKRIEFNTLKEEVDQRISEAVKKALNMTPIEHIIYGIKLLFKKSND